MRATIAKKTGIQILHADDEMSFFMGQGMQCDPGQTLDEGQFDGKAKLGTCTADQQSWSANNIKMNDIITWS